MAPIRTPDAARSSALEPIPAWRPGGRSHRVTRWAAAPGTGLPLLALALAAVFGALFSGGTALAALLDRIWAAYASPLVQSAVHRVVGHGVMGRTLLWGLDAGSNAVLSVGIPYVLTFYLLLAILQESGYLTVMATLLNRALRHVGLTGDAAVLLVAAGGCNVPAIIGLRTLRTDRERLIAGTLITLVPCSARTAVIFGGVAYLAGWRPALLLYGVVAGVTLAAGWGLNRLLPGRPPEPRMANAAFRTPALRSILRVAWMQVRDFVAVAMPLVLAGSVVLGALYETGAIRLAARPLAPIVEGWLGLPPVAGLALVFAVLRKELALQLLAALAIMQYGRGADGMLAFMTPAQIFVYALVNTLYIPCAATISVLARALGHRRAATVSAGTIALAVLAGGVANALIN